MKEKGEMPLIVSESREELLAEVKKSAGDSGITFSDPKGLANTLFTLYSYFWSETAERLNRTPEKHRIAFLNCLQAAHFPAQVANTFVVFHVVKGTGRPVKVPEGTVLTAVPEDGGESVGFRTKWNFWVVPSSIRDILWADCAADTACRVYSDVRDPSPEAFEPWCGAKPDGRHRFDMAFRNVLGGEGENLDVALSMNVRLRDPPLPAGALADPVRFRWSLTDWSPEPDGALGKSVRVTPKENSGLALSADGFRSKEPLACLSLELLDGSARDLSFEQIEICAEKSGLSPDAVVMGDCQLDGNRFYPFRPILHPFEECGVFCGEALSKHGAEITLSFRLSVETTEEHPQRREEAVNYKWIMRKPLPKPKEEVQEAFASSVKWEYWNGKAFRTISGKCGAADDFSKDGELRLVFDCPDDISLGEYGGRKGYFLRLSCGECRELYRLPRRVHTPCIQNARFSYRFLSPLRPERFRTVNFGDRAELPADFPVRPFSAPPCRSKSLFLGLDWLSGNLRVQMCAALDEPQEADEKLTMEILGETGWVKMAVDDETGGLRRSGLISFLTPPSVQKRSLFGAERYWIRMTPPANSEGLKIKGFYLNAQRVENRVRHRRGVPLQNLPKSGILQLPHGNLIKTWVFVKSADDGKWELWKEFLPGCEFRQGLYKIDHSSGRIYFPPQIFYRASTPDDVIFIVYDTGDGKRANVAAGAINKMRKEIPYIASIRNPFPVLDGYDSEKDEELASRAENLLYTHGHAVTEKDYELMALDLCPEIYRARCIGGTPVRLAVLLDVPDSRVVFPRICRTLLPFFRACGAARTAGTQIEILRAVSVPMGCSLNVRAKDQPIGEEIETLEEKLTAFFDPIGGGLRGDGWEIGRLPTFDQILSFLEEGFPRLQISDLSAAVLKNGRTTDLQEITPGPFDVPGPVKIKVEISA
ncbi:hypothetical protein A7X67_02735 [Clostridium sp. W14A]|nr:hypothetical protein A7X67_02735 [Clostridium sp. W14A]